RPRTGNEACPVFAGHFFRHALSKHKLPWRQRRGRHMSVRGKCSRRQFECSPTIRPSTFTALQNECLNRKGSVVGRCANGFAACCSFKFTCGAETNQNETLFVNRQYPQAE